MQLIITVNCRSVQNPSKVFKVHRHWRLVAWPVSGLLRVVV